ECSAGWLGNGAAAKSKQWKPCGSRASDAEAAAEGIDRTRKCDVVVHEGDIVCAEARLIQQSRVESMRPVEGSVIQTSGRDLTSKQRDRIRTWVVLAAL